MKAMQSAVIWVIQTAAIWTAIIILISLIGWVGRSLIRNLFRSRSRGVTFFPSPSPSTESNQWHCDLCGGSARGRFDEAKNRKLPPVDWLFLKSGEESGLSVDICICDNCWRAIWRATIYGRNQ